MCNVYYLFVQIFKILIMSLQTSEIHCIMSNTVAIVNVVNFSAIYTEPAPDYFAP